MNAFLVVAGVLGVIILVLYTIEELRDRAAKLGLISPDSRSRVGRWWWRTYARAYSAQAQLVAQSLHLDGAIVDQIRSATDPLARETRKLTTEIQSRPDVSFLRRMQPWIYELPAPLNYRGSRCYLDMMGATYQRRQHEPSLEQIFVAWLDSLRHGGVFGAFDVVLVPKDGNPLLAAAVAAAGFKQLIVCKGETDRARVNRPAAAAPHETDFEGLRAFLNMSLMSIGPSRLFRAVAIDDSCANGSQLASAVRRFNDLVSSDITKYPFEPISNAVTLFRVLRSGLDNGAFINQNLRLHALVAVGDAELDEIRSTDIKKIAKRADRFKQEEFSCASSRNLLSG